MNTARAPGLPAAAPYEVLRLPTGHLALRGGPGGDVPVDYITDTPLVRAFLEELVRLANLGGVTAAPSWRDRPPLL
jgi:hypothetical protein